MRNPFRAYIRRQTLISLRNSIFSIFAKFSHFIRYPMADTQSSSNSPHTTSQSSENSPQFDPFVPSTPVSYPMKTLEELESRSYFDSFHYPFNISSVPLPDYSSNLGLPNRPRLLVCHDMAGGYLDDKWVQGGENPEAYAIWHWYLIDVFVYFSHDLVTLPPPCWTNAAHNHGVKVLGTFITEWDEGRLACNTLLSTKESVQMYAERLAELAVALGFDGWLLNFEVELEKGQIPNLIEFVRHLTQTMHSSKPDSLVIWYDSVTVHGNLSWQDQLNDFNKPFFDSCDGIFVNYTWTRDYPKHSAVVAGQRKFDVYMGVDVFGRNTYGGGQWNTNLALDVLREDDVSAAIFAPGWVYETKQPPDFQTAQNRWWALVEKSWGITQSYPRALPFYTNFDQGHGYDFSVDGGLVSNAAWCNISCQSFQVKLGGNSLMGLSLEFSSSANKREAILLASKGNALLTMTQFSSKFSTVIMPCQVTELKTVEGWIIQEYNISMEAHTLMTIHAVCYKLNPEINEPKLNSTSNYHAELGHLTITDPGQNVVFPPSSSWLVDGQFIKWEAGAQGSKFLSLNITWKPKDSDRFLLPKYIIHVEKIAENADTTPTGKLEYLGVAAVQAFYVSRLLVPSGTSSLKFIIQVCGADGTHQNLDDCPSYQLDVD
ncbi:hypothetical protein Ancab_034525 [Ancistrocladus abbreviatus]